MRDIIFAQLQILERNPIFLFLVTFVASEWCLLYLEKIPLETPYMRFKEKSICAFVNAVVVVVIVVYLEVTSPMILLTGCPLLIVIELALMCRDKITTYIYLLAKLLVNFICIYWLIVSSIGITSAQYVHGDLIFPLTLFTSGWWSLLLAKNKAYPIKELKVMVHDSKAGTAHFTFLATCVGSLFFSTVILRPVILGDFSDEGNIQGVFFAEMFIKTSLIFMSGYLLLYLKAKELREKEKSILISQELEKEEHFRRSTQRDAFVSYYVNATADQIREGRDCFSAFMWHDINNYAEMLQKMAFLCVYKEDVTEFVGLNTLADIEEKLRQGITTDKQTLRVAPKEMAKLFTLPAELKQAYLETEDEWVWIETKYVYSRDTQTGDISLFVSITDVNEEMKKSQELVINATVDKLTGVYNRAALQSRIEEKIQDGLETGEPVGTMILLDVDFFKSINDLLGHPTGDVALQTIAMNLKEIFRVDDIVGRLGGDEFCVFMKGATDVRIVRTRLQQINEKCRKDYPVPGGEPIHVSVSIGAVICTPGMTSYEMLYQYADEALYHTKARGKNSYTIYNDLKA